jgi:plasmid maintenance system antidote protein VapI
MQHNRESVRRALLRMKQSQLAGAFDCYAGAVNALVAQRERVARTMAKWKSPGLKRAMEAWTEYLEMMHGEQAQDAQELAKQQLEAAAKEHRSRAEAEAERRIEMCRRVVQRMLQQQLLMAWSMFVDTVREMQHNRESVRRALLRMKQSQLAGAFDCYAGAVNALVAQRERVAKTVARFQRRTAIFAMNLWFTYRFIAALEERVEHDRRNVLMRSLISRILQAALARVCWRWFEYVSQVSGYLKLIYVYTRVHARARVYTRARAHTHTQVREYSKLHTHTHTHTHTRTHVGSGILEASFSHTDAASGAALRHDVAQPHIQRLESVDAGTRASFSKVLLQIVALLHGVYTTAMTSTLEIGCMQAQALLRSVLARQKFSKVLHTVALHSKATRSLTFQNLCQTSRASAAGYQRCVCVGGGVGVGVCQGTKYQKTVYSGSI